MTQVYVYLQPQNVFSMFEDVMSICETKNIYLITFGKSFCLLFFDGRQNCVDDPFGIGGSKLSGDRGLNVFCS